MAGGKAFFLSLGQREGQGPMKFSNLIRYSICLSCPHLRWWNKRGAKTSKFLSSNFPKGKNRGEALLPNRGVWIVVDFTFYDVCGVFYLFFVFQLATKSMKLNILGKMSSILANGGPRNMCECVCACVCVCVEWSSLLELRELSPSV